jgi:hypothetical protein
MAITSTDNQTAAAPAVEVPVANKTDSPPADEGEPKLETSKPVTSRRLSASQPLSVLRHKSFGSSDFRALRRRYAHLLITRILRGATLQCGIQYTRTTPTLAAVSRRRPCYVPCGGLDELVHDGLQQAARPAQLHARSVRRARLARSYDLGVERHLGRAESGEARRRRTEAEAGACGMRHAACGMRSAAHPAKEGHAKGSGHALGTAARTGEDVGVCEVLEQLGASLAQQCQARLAHVATL